MAEVYAGVHPDLGRKVAIKVILPQFATETNFEERFRREARVVASLRHAHIVQLYDFDVVDGRHFMVMEYLGGGTLKGQLRGLQQQKTRMPLSKIADLADAMGSALDYAHGRGAIHRDIKPANILFSAEREPVLTDFGIAKLLEDAAHLTATGGVVGSPFYMSPEQATGGAVSAASDQYSLGVVLYEMATGRVPFQGSSAVAVMTQHLNRAPPSPRTVNAALPDAVAGVLLKALAKRPDDRFAAVGELAQAFRHAAEGRSSQPVPSLPADETARTVLNDAGAAVSDSPTVVSADARSVTSGEDAATILTTGADATASSPASSSPAPLERGEPPRIETPTAGASQPPVPSARALPAPVDANRPSDDRQLPAAPATAPQPPAKQRFNVGGIQAGIVNQGGEQTFTGDLTFNLNFGDIKAAPPQAKASSEDTASEAMAARGDAPELAAILEALRRAFAGSARADRLARLVTQFHAQLEALPVERAGDRNQAVRRVQALLMELTTANPDPDLVEIMGASLERAVQPLSSVDPELPTMVTRITSWVELMVQPG
jgi:serine/threonine protein kinase